MSDAPQHPSIDHAPGTGPVNIAEQSPRAERRRRARASNIALIVSAIVVTVLIVVLGTLAAWPIYETARLWIVAGVSAALAFVTVWLGLRLRWGALTLAALAGVFTLLVLPLGVPSALTAGPLGWLRGLGDGLAAVALGWKQLLTLSLPVGSYQTVLVPFLTIIFVSVAVAVALALRGGRWIPFAAVGLIAPVLFGTIFGSSAVSAPLNLFGLSIGAPRELGLWLGAFGLAAGWIAWASGRDRRAALRRGRDADAALELGEGSAGADGDAAPANGRSVVRRNFIVRAAIASATVVAALAGSLALAPVVNGDVRTVPRDAIDPELVVRSGVSPLSAYRAWKRDDTLEAPLFTVSSEDGQLPGRLRLAVLSGYDGVDFSVGDPREVGRFTRFPSGGSVPDPVRVTVQIQSGYDDIWVPIATPLAEPPVFFGPRAGELADSFYLNRDTGSAVSVPEGEGLVDGDGFTARMSAGPDATVGNAPISESSLIDLGDLPELERWLKLQELPSTGAGVTEAVERLRDRGYLSHSLSDGDGEGAWIRKLARAHSIRFVSSPGGHSAARIEQLFSLLNEQQLAAGPEASADMLVAGVGNDEQFATAAALVARAMGFDSRVVIGVRLGAEDSGVPGIPACSDVCTGENLTAWIEVQGSDGVWAPLDVSPQIENAPTMLQKGEQLPEFPTQPEQRDASESDPPVGMSNQEGGDTGDSGEDGLNVLWPILRLVGLITLGLALLVLLALFIPIVKRVRARKRRAAASPEVQALGAWDELLSAYVDGGTVFTTDVGRDHVMRELNIEGGDWIAWTVDQAVYSREGISEETVELLWTVVDTRVAEKRAELGFWQKLRSRYSLASFGGLLGRKGTGAKERRTKRGALR